VLALGLFTYHLAGLAVVEKKASVEVVAQVDQKIEAIFLHQPLLLFSIDLLVLLLAFLAFSFFKKDQKAGYFQYFGDGIQTSFQPGLVLEFIQTMVALVFGNMHSLLVTVNDQREIGQVVVVNAVTGYALAARPFADVAIDFLQAVFKLQYIH
jgi:hypothetical protein